MGPSLEAERWEDLLQSTLYEPVGLRVFEVKLRGNYQKKGELVLGKKTHQWSRTLSLPPPSPPSMVSTHFQLSRLCLLCSFLARKLTPHSVAPMPGKPVSHK